jgi:hypothetical protein
VLPHPHFRANTGDVTRKFIQKNENAFVSLSAGERVFLVQAQAQYARDKSFTLQQTEQAANRTSSKQGDFGI